MPDVDYRLKENFRGASTDGSVAKTPIVIVADYLVPTPEHDAASHRLVEIMEILLSLGVAVVFFPVFGPPQVDTSVLVSRGIGVIASGEGQRQFLHDYGDRVALAVLSRPQTVPVLMAPLREFAACARIVYDTVDLHHVRLGRQAELAEALSGDERFRLQAEAVSLEALETYLASIVDVTLTVSEHDAELMRQAAPGADVRVVPTVHPTTAPRPQPETNTVAFVGNYLHAPNVDAVIWFADRILPLVRASVPDVLFEVIGGAAPQKVLALSGANVVVRGWVPDLGAALARVAVGVAPLRFGSGVKGKIGEMARRAVPLVCTTLAVEGMHLVPGVDALVADDEAAFAGHVVALLADRSFAQTIARSGRDRVEEHFGTGRVAAQLASLLRH
ncbi:glycosyltransferase family 4 protein [Rathayibacter tritici]|uniref:glycosyltransferase family 4 protein n=1 Tax=Rathayibacter tritici TaxID=33888 RepID=UPI0011B0BAB7|nr:glycosyltransferase family 4 protein [Rathayibacter tritici]